MIGQSPQHAPSDEVVRTPDQASGGAEEARPVDSTSTSSPESPLPPAPREWGGREGPEPTRYGDWEKNGRCIDF
jgi:hypothetical protein